MRQCFALKISLPWPSSFLTSCTLTCRRMQSITVTWSKTLLAWSDASETDVLLSVCTVGERADYHKESLASHSSDQLSELFSPPSLAGLCFIMVGIAQSYCTVILPSENSCGLDPILWMTAITVGLLFLARPCYFVKAQTLLVGYTYLKFCYG